MAKKTKEIDKKHAVANVLSEALDTLEKQGIDKDYSANLFSISLAE